MIACYYTPHIRIITKANQDILLFFQIVWSLHIYWYTCRFKTSFCVENSDFEIFAELERLYAGVARLYITIYDNAFWCR